MSPKRASSMMEGRLLFPLLLALSVTGCGGGGTGTVSGTITLNGRPLPSGSISFLSEVGNRDATSCPIVDGAFTSPPLRCGRARIIVLWWSGPASKGPAADAVTASAEGRPTERPGKFGNPDTSGLAIDVLPGENAFDVDLNP